MKIFTFFLLFMVFLSACSPMEKKSIAPKQKKKTYNITRLNNEIKELDSYNKRLIYKSIKKEIQRNHKKGDEAYKNGYYYDAVKAYELVNFYEGYPVIPRKKIANIKTIAKKRAYLHYKNAKKYLHSDRKKALIELNSVMMNKPDYKDAKRLYKLLRNNRAIQIHINMLENSLETKIINNKGSFKELKAIKNNLNNLAKYDYKDESLQKARALLQSEKNIMLKNAIAAYKKRELKKAKQKFIQVRTLYPDDDTTATKYLKRIAFKQSKKQNLAMAKEALKQNKYLASISYAKKVLLLEPQNTQAKEIIATANKKAKAAVKKFVNEGKRYYNNKNLDKAKEYFQKALEIDKTNNTSLIYYKKIQRQLQTIKSLQ
ncbi:hypothetical protein MNB_SM-6-265 [hydrothermal vent metagenome]|uniref:Uncharacterized protein n=1 Tax=hydrothermal vent metagenome TaxID=652676 RepID=A0A1W1CJR6_9ZZZZ